ncbi:MAG: hypothetical protein FJ100_02170 [Deltaproteobacteria bacterium]|nr:hypothetical protein [Deltaproteobacteria bacterium]
MHRTAARPFRLPRAACAIVALAAMIAGGCNDYPVHSLLDSFEVRVTRQLARDKAVKIDFLWVIDHSSSMCQEQRALANGFQKFIKSLQDYGKVKETDPSFIDAQMAVVTVQQVPDGKSIKKIGKFVHSPATTLPPSCIEKSKQPCMSDGDCFKPKCFVYSNFDTNSCMCPQGGEKCLTPAGLKAGDWFCKFSPPEPPATINTFNNNDNCSVNTSCQLRCKTDSDCYAMFEPTVPPGGAHKVFCNTVVQPAGCMFKPETTGCPPAEKLPGVLKQTVAAEVDLGDGVKKKGTQLDLFRCNATVGANQEPEALFEGGLRSAWIALDPNGPNCPRDKNGKPTGTCQYNDLVRQDAYLVIVMVSDDDDCSITFELDSYLGDITSDDQKALLLKLFPKELQRSCQGYNDRVAGNRDLLVGYCEYARFKDPVGKKRKCPAECENLADKASQEYKDCTAEAEANIAALLKDNPQGQLRNWRFAAVSDFVNRFKSLKSDPARVIFATITGDALKPSAPVPGWTVERDRASYYRSVLRNTAGVQSVYICSGERGESGYGSRYIQVADAFGDNGLVANICEGADFSVALQNVADLILSRVVKVCLPHPPSYDPATKAPLIKVSRQRGTAKIQMKYVSGPSDKAANGDSFYVKATADCLIGKAGLSALQGQACKSTKDCPAGLACQDGLCKVYGEAIYFPVTPQQGDVIEVNYPADIGL